MIKRTISLEELLEIVEEVSSISKNQITSKSRTQDIVDARQAFCCAAYYNGYSFEAIAEKLNRTHSTIVNMCNDTPLSYNSSHYLTICMKHQRIEHRISGMAHRLYKNPNDNYAKQELKKLL